MATLETQQLDEIIVNSRRKMLTLGGAALAGMVFSSTKAEAQAATLTDADYLNFALNLEYLEAQFYTLATAGLTIDQLGVGINGTGTQGMVTTKGNNNYNLCKINFLNPVVEAYAVETAREERNHVIFLRGALGSAAVAQPAIDLVNSFNGLASLLVLSPPLTAFDPFGGDIQFLLGSYIFEDVGVTAYTGAAPKLTDPKNLDAAAGIQGVEAYHAGLIRTTLYGLDQQATVLGPAGTARAVASAISALRASVDGSNSVTSANPQGDDIGLGTEQVALNTSTQNFTSATLANASITGSLNPPVTGTTTANALVFSRSAAQVLKIVYAGGTTSGGFFPAGLNGTVKSAA